MMGSRLMRGATLLGLALLAASCSDTPTEKPIAPAPDAARTSAAAGPNVIIGFTAVPGAGELALVQSVGGAVTHQYAYIPAVAAAVPAGAESVLRADPRVAYVEPNFTMVPLGSRQVHDWGITKIDAPGAWSAGYTGKGIKVGIFDSGIDIDHPDLRVAGGVDLVGDGNGLDDCDGHGTHVAGIVGATNNGRYTVGAAHKAELYSMRFADCAWAGATLDKMIQGVEWAIDNGMDVVNMSFGFSVPIPSEAAEAAFDAAYARGVVLVAASGNSSTPVVGYPAAYASVIAVGATDDQDMIAQFSQWGEAQELTAPGVNVLASYLVGLGQETSLFVDSDGGRELDAIALAFAGMTGKRGLSAPTIYALLGTPADYEGVDCTGKTAVVARGGISFAEKATYAMDAGCAAIIIHNNQPGSFNGTLGTETAPDGRAWIPAVSITLDDGLYLKEQIETRETRTTMLNVAGNTAILSGTSMASPYAAGVAALVLSKNPNLTPDEVRQVLRSSADDLGTPGWDPVFGYGRINAARAVQ